MLTYQINNVDKLIRDFDISKPLFCDTETNVFYSKIRLFQMYQEHWSDVLLFDIRDIPLQGIYDIVKGATTIWHNYSYDGACFCNDLNIKENPFKNFEDTLLLARLYLWRELDSFSLDNCFEFILGYDPYKALGGDKKVLQKSFISTKRKNMSILDLEKIQLLYASTDVYYLPKLYNLVKESKDIKLYKEDKKFIANALRWQQFGMPIDKNKREIEVEKANELVLNAKTILPKDLNTNSPLQVKKYLNTECSDKTTLLELSKVKGSKEAQAILDARKGMKLLNFLDRYNFKRVRGYFSPTAISGRVRCSGSDEIDGTDNLMQIPTSLKGIFGFDENSNKYLVYCDYAQLELRTICCITGDENLDKILRSGKDMHSATAELMFNIPYKDVKSQYPDKRKAAKFCSFCLLYAGSANALANAFLVQSGEYLPLDDAANYRKMWLRAYPQISKWQEKARDKANAGDYTTKTPGGRNVKCKLYTDICGIENQGLGAELAKQALNLFLEKNPNAKPLCFIHDSIIVEADNLEEAKRLGKDLGEAMEKSWYLNIQGLPIDDLPMPLEVSACKNLKDVDNEENIIFKIDKSKEEVLIKNSVFEEEISKPWTYNKHLIVDGDTLFYIAAIEAEEADFETACENVRGAFKHLREKTFCDSMEIHLTGKRCFRYNIDKSYKVKRKDTPKPKYLWELKNYFSKKAKNVFLHDFWEADDAVVEMKLKNPDFIICALDKDILRSVEGEHYNMKTGEQVITKENEARFFPYLQCIMGDPSDSISGVPGVGPKNALKFINENMDEKELWRGVVRAFESKGLSREDAVRTMRLINMRQLKNNEIVLWEESK